MDLQVQLSITNAIAVRAGQCAYSFAIGTAGVLIIRLGLCVGAGPSGGVVGSITLRLRGNVLTLPPHHQFNGKHRRDFVICSNGFFVVVQCSRVQ